MLTKTCKTSSFVLAAMISLTAMSPGAMADESGDLLEQAIYAEETQGDLNKAIHLYRNIVDDAAKNRSEAAVAMYRLGVCYRAKGDVVGSKEILMRLVNEMADQADVVVDAKALLVELDNTRLELLPEPWLDGEEESYRLYLQTGRRIGSLTTSFRKKNVNGSDLWLLESSIMGGNALYMSSDVTVSEFKPVVSQSLSPQLGHVNSTYSDGNIHTTFKKKEGNVEKDTAITKNVFDVSQASAIFRRLPLVEGYKTDLQFYQPVADMLLDAALKVTGRGQSVFQGIEYDTYNVVVEFNMHGILVQTFKFTITDDEQRRILESDDGSLISKLDRVMQKGGGELAQRAYPELGLAFSLDQGKQVVYMGFRDKSVAMGLGIFDPGFKNRMTVTAITPETDDDDASMRVPANKREYHLRGLRKKHENIELTEDGNEPVIIAGKPASSLSVKIKEKGRTKIFMRVYVEHNGNLYYFSMDTAEKHLEKRRKEFIDFLDGVEFL